MRNDRKSRLPTIGGGTILLDPRPGVGVNTSCLQQCKHQFLVMLDVLTFERHLITPRLVVVPKELVVAVLNLRVYDLINGDADHALGCVQPICNCNLPVVPTVVCPTHAGVDSSNMNLAVIAFGFLAFHGFDHYPRVPAGLRARACHGL